MQFSKIIGITIAVVMIVGCSSVEVSKYDGQDPKGVPFYLTKPIVEITTVEYTYIDKASATTISSYQSEERKIINVIDKDEAYTINHRRPFAGESKMKISRSAAANGISSSDLASVEVENKEGVTEFLKGLVEGTKTLSEVAKSLGEAAAVAGAFTTGEATYFTTLAGQGIVVTKRVVSIRYEDL